MARLQSSALSNQNLSTALLVGTYTPSINRTSILCQVLATQVAGNGLYTVYATRQIGGTGAAYEYQGRATVLVESGVTAIAFPSVVIPALANDVIRVYLVGLAGDTTTPDIICEFWDLGFLSPTVADRTLDVSATGEAGVDWANVGSPTTTVGLSGTTVGVVTNVTNNQAKYMNGAVWVNTVTGATGTTNYTNGVMTNPSNSLPNGKTIADSLNLKKFWIQAGSSIALSADMIGYVLDGASWTLSSASARNISGTTIRGCENLTGTYTSPTQECYVYDCQVGTSTWGEVDFHGCHIVGTITLNAAVPYLFDRCMGIPANSPTINFGSTAGARSAILYNYGNSLTITNMRVGNVLNIDGDCDLTIDASCTGGTVYINGNIALTNNGTGLTIYDTSRYGEDQAVASVSAGVTVSDKTGFALTAAYDAAKTAASQASVDALPTMIEAAIAAIPSAPTVGQIDTQLSATHGAGAWGAGTLGAGAISTTVTVTVSGLPRDGVEVWLTTDSAGLNVVASGISDAMGHITFMLDAGTYYAWKQLSGINFTNPETLVVS